MGQYLCHVNIPVVLNGELFRSFVEALRDVRAVVRRGVFSSFQLYLQA